MDNPRTAQGLFIDAPTLTVYEMPADCPPTVYGHPTNAPRTHEHPIKARRPPSICLTTSHGPTHTPWTPHGLSADCLWTANRPFTDCPRTLHGLPVDYRRTVRGHPTDCQRALQAMFTDCLWTSHRRLRIVDRQPTYPPWTLHQLTDTPHGYLTNCSRTAYGRPTDYRRISHGLSLRVVSTDRLYGLSLWTPDGPSTDYARTVHVHPTDWWQQIVHEPFTDYETHELCVFMPMDSPWTVRGTVRGQSMGRLWIVN